MTVLGRETQEGMGVGVFGVQFSVGAEDFRKGGRSGFAGFGGVVDADVAERFDEFVDGSFEFAGVVLDDAQETAAARGEGGGVGAADEFVLEDVFLRFDRSHRAGFVEATAAADFRFVGVNKNDGAGRHAFEHARGEAGEVAAGAGLDRAVGVEKDVFRALDDTARGAPLHFLLDIGAEVAHFVAVGDESVFLAHLEHFGAEGDDGVVQFFLHAFPRFEEDGRFAGAGDAGDDDEFGHRVYAGGLILEDALGGAVGQFFEGYEKFAVFSVQFCEKAVG